MVSIGFEAVANLKRLNFTLKGVLPGKVYFVTRGATSRSDLQVLRDAPGGCFVVLLLEEAPMGRLLDSEHVLLIGVQHVTGMWVLRALRKRMRQYFSALKVEQADADWCNGMENVTAAAAAAGMHDGPYTRSHICGGRAPDGAAA